ncbi:hypothetical protein M8C21_017285 [Ambrosia artemisiifolia]|uniref:Mitochondrial import inner membrane translocase subunit TIM50 n=1 Tax=Ambrosia artemisiifolia TaxID=4212 RepID=A0AAD5BJS8_AMBAR|nr:hypothetical protein M8C21_017285 [Ambrosia artemisiifolia]
MSMVTRSRQFFSIVKRRNKNPRLYSSVSANGHSEPVISSSILGNQPTSSIPPPPLESAAVDSGVGGKPWSFLKYTLVAALTGGVATAGYATYAYTLEEVDEKTKALRASAKFSGGIDLSSFDRDRGWRTFKRPGVDDFLEHLAQFYEIIVYSDQQSMYVDPVVDRDPSRVLYVSGNALESCLQSENCVPIKPWKCETEDTTLLDLIPFLEYVARHRPADIRPVLASYKGHDIAKEFIERSKEHQRRRQEQKQQGRLWRF